MRRTAAVLTLALVVAVPALPSRAASGEDPLDEARNAAAGTNFSGRVVVQWREGSVPRQQELDVRGAGGAFAAEGGRQVMGMENERLVFSPSDGWHELWTNSQGAVAQPDLHRVYDVQRAGEASVAGENTDVYELSKLGVLRERLYLDKNTRLLLRRVQLDRKGQKEREFSFERIAISAPVTAPTIPKSREADAPTARSTEGSPARLDEGYQRIGSFRHGDVTELLYGDGVYNLSLFEQPGRVDAGDLPAQRSAVHVDGRRAWQFSWAGGQGVVWSAGTTVYTLVGDVPPDELMLVANSVPVHRTTSIGHRLRLACRALVQTFTGGR